MAVGQIGPYRVKGLIADGAQGKVYCGYDERLQRQVAIKLIAQPYNHKGRQSVLEEARAVAAIHHPRVVDVFDVLTVGNYIALVYEYVRGCNLSQLQSNTMLSLASIVSIALDVASALDAAHSVGIIHRDLKSSNVLVGIDGYARLADFGIARKAGQSINEDHRGSLICVAPEQYRGDTATAQTDFFALGLLLYQLLYRKHPFYDDNALNEQRLLNGDYDALNPCSDLRDDVPIALSDLMVGLLQLRPENRPANALQIRQRLLGVLQSLPLSTSHQLGNEARRVALHAPPLESIPLPADLGAAQAVFPGRLALARRLRESRFTVATVGILLALSMPASTALLRNYQHHAAADPSGELQLEVASPQYNTGGIAHIGVTREWIERAIRGAITQYQPNLHVLNEKPITQTIDLDSHGNVMPTQPAGLHRLEAQTECTQVLCLLNVYRDAPGIHRSAQRLLFANDPASQWQANIEQSIQQLYEELD